MRYLLNKYRTTIYISESARNKVQENEINLSAFVEDAIFNAYGYSASRHELEQELGQAQGKVKVLQERLDNYADLDNALQEYIDKIASSVKTCKYGWSIERYMKAFDLYMRERPMCDMSFQQLHSLIERALESES